MNTPADLCRILGCRLPLVLAGMGGVARAELCAAVSEAGGFGLLGMVRESPRTIREEIAEVRRRTSAPFGVSLIPFATDPQLLGREVSVCIDEQVSAVCLFWDVDRDLVVRLKQAGVTVLYQVGTVAAARAAVLAGADIVIAQGIEAGGHVHGRMARDELVARLSAEFTLPVIAAGGVAAAGDLRHVLRQGAAGALLGSVLLATRESFAHDCHKQALVSGRGNETLLTERFFINWPPGAAVRVLPNSVTEGPGPDPQLREIIATEAGRPVFRCSTDSPLRNTVGRLAAMPHYAGTGIDAITQVRSAADVMADIATGYAETNTSSV